MTRMVNCVKLGREAEGLDFPPYPGELGKRIYENVSKEAWAQWLKHQTMLVNENRLSLADPRARKWLAELFVLTTRTAHWFLERGFRTASVADLPQHKQALYNYQRKSLVYVKNL